VTDLGGGIDELDIDHLSLPRLDGGEDRLPEGDGSLASSDDTALDEDVILVDLTVMGEATEGRDVLGHGVSLGSGVVLDTVNGTGTNTVDLLVELSSRVITLLTTTGHCPLDSGWMPGTDTGDLPATSMRFTLETLDIESADDTHGTVTLGDTDAIDALALLEDLTNADLLLELAVSPVDLSGDVATVNLDLKKVSLVLTESELADLRGAENADDGGVFLNALKITGVMSLAGLLGLVLPVDVLGESLLLGVHPVLVEATLDVVVEVLGPDGRERAHAAGGLDVSNEANDLHWGALDDGGGVDDILLDGLLTFATLLVLDDVSHAGLVAHEGGKVNRLGGVITGE